VAQNVFRIPATIDIHRFRHAWEAAVKSLAILRTRIVYTPVLGSLQVILDERGHLQPIGIVVAGQDGEFDRPPLGIRQRTVLFGGFPSYGGTWEWNGSSWTQVGTNGPTRWSHAMAYDSARARVVLFGGSSGSVRMNDTWEWVEKDLTLITVPGAGHFVHRDKPEFVTRKMVGWLTER
jgi:pimeloyl-ACP methyl ester carboxylesterase